MGLTPVAYDTLTSVISSEHTLTTQTGIGVYVLVVDLTNMASGDTVTLRLKNKVLAAGATDTIQEVTLSDAQDIPHWMSDPIPSDLEIICTITQSAGSSRDYPWRLLRA